MDCLPPQDSAAACLIVLAGPPAWYLPRSLLMLRLHARYITEFMSPLNSLAFSVYARDPLLLVGLIALAVALFLLRKNRAPFPFRPALQTLAVATGLMFLLFGWQGRWQQFLPPIIFLLAGYGLAAMRHSRPSGSANSFVRPLPLLLALTLLIQTGLATRIHLHLIYKALRVEQLDALWNRYMLQRNMLLHLKAEAGGNSLRLIPPVEMAPAVYYFGVGDSIGSLYWENLDGLAAASEFMADPLPGSQAHTIAQKRSITHILSLRIPDEAYMYHYLLTGTDNPAERSSTLGYVLFKGGPGVPAWATPIILCNWPLPNLFMCLFPPPDAGSPSRPMEESTASSPEQTMFEAMWDPECRRCHRVAVAALVERGGC